MLVSREECPSFLLEAGIMSWLASSRAERIEMSWEEQIRKGFGKRGFIIIPQEITTLWV